MANHGRGRSAMESVMVKKASLAASSAFSDWFSARISECRYQVDSVSYTDSFGVTVSASESSTVKTTLGFSDNRYMWDTDEDPYKQYRRPLSRIINHFRNFSWYPGTVEYYGNPALDLGDIVTIEDGVAGSRSSVKFLITAILNQFFRTKLIIMKVD